MTAPAHHPSTEVLTAYAAGALEPGFGLVVAAHLEFCAHCRAQVGRYEAASGAALQSLPEAPVGADALARVMAQLDAPAEAVPSDTRPFLERLRVKPRKYVIPGLWVAEVDTPHARDNRVYLLGAAPGALTAKHTHSGAEFCTVLKGAFRDETGLYGVGDFAAGDGDLLHQPKTEPGAECICLFATEGRLKAQGALGRLAFRYAGV